MKKFILSFVFSMLVSVAVFANPAITNVEPAKTVETITVSASIDDGWWDCYLIDSDLSDNPISGETTQTNTYRCWCVSF